MKKASPRKFHLFDGKDVPTDFTSYNEQNIKEEGKGVIKFDKLGGRIPHNSIYKGFIPPDVHNYDNLLYGYSQLGHMRKTTYFSMANMKSRDDEMYLTNQAYKSNIENKLLNNLDKLNNEVQNHTKK